MDLGGSRGGCVWDSRERCVAAVGPGRAELCQTFRLCVSALWRVLKVLNYRLRG